MKILLVGPGIMPIPNDGWGAVEILIWQLKIHLEKQGHKVDILNERGLKAALKAQPWKYDLVHLHYDELADSWIKLARWLKLRLVITTHYGYAALPDRWDDYYKKIFTDLMRSPALLVLSPEIEQVFLDHGYKGWIRVSPNGTEASVIKFKPRGNGKAICLGKIEPRKQQAKLARKINELGSVSCDFAGPIIDKTFKPDDKHTKYLGTWTRQEVQTKLTNYSTLVLISDGEAHSLVVLEALAAGLSVVVSEEASANLDRSLPWINVCQKVDAKAIGTIKKAVNENHKYRSQIRDYAEKNFDWAKVTERYVKIVSEYAR